MRIAFERWGQTEQTDARSGGNPCGACTPVTHAGRKSVLFRRSDGAEAREPGVCAQCPEPPFSRPSVVIPVAVRVVSERGSTPLGGTIFHLQRCIRLTLPDRAAETQEARQDRPLARRFFRLPVGRRKGDGRRASAEVSGETRPLMLQAVVARVSTASEGNLETSMSNPAKPETGR